MPSLYHYSMLISAIIFSAKGLKSQSLTLSQTRQSLPRNQIQTVQTHSTQSLNTSSRLRLPPLSNKSESLQNHKLSIDTEECPICLEALNHNDTQTVVKANTLFNCQHEFHKRCIDHWLTQDFASYKKSCPVCREEFKLSSLDATTSKQYMLKMIANSSFDNITLDWWTEFGDDEEVALAAVTKCGSSLVNASQRLIDNKEIVTAAVKQNGGALKYASVNLRNDREVVIAAVRQDGRAIQSANPFLKGDKEIVMIAVKSRGKAYHYIYNKLKKDPEVLDAALEGCLTDVEYQNVLNEAKRVKRAEYQECLCSLQ